MCYLKLEHEVLIQIRKRHRILPQSICYLFPLEKYIALFSTPLSCLQPLLKQHVPTQFPLVQKLIIVNMQKLGTKAQGLYRNTQRDNKQACEEYHCLPQMYDSMMGKKLKPPLPQVRSLATPPRTPAKHWVGRKGTRSYLETEPFFK
jgi:hypothetical protein